MDFPQKLKQFADIVCRFLLQERSKFENFLTVDALIIDHAVCFTVGGAKRRFRGLAHAWRNHRNHCMTSTESRLLTGQEYRTEYAKSKYI